jgi:hypothetical protein
MARFRTEVWLKLVNISNIIKMHGSICCKFVVRNLVAKHEIYSKSIRSRASSRSEYSATSISNEKN